MNTHHDHPPTTPAPADHAHRPQFDPGPDGHEGHADHTGHGGHASHAGHGDHVAQFRRLFWIMLVLAVPTVAFNDMFADMWAQDNDPEPAVPTDREAAVAAYNAGGVTYADLAEIYGVSPSTIGRWVRHSRTT